MNSLKAKGLNIEKVNPEKAADYDCVWRFGDVRFGSYSEFSTEFRELLIQKQQNDLVLNTVPESPREDIGNKKFLLSENEYELETEEDAKRALSQEDMVLKPFRGTSGKGIYFQKNMSQYEWREKVFDSVGKGYGLFESKWLPMLDVEEITKGVVMDLPPSFLARNEKLDYLYTISRIEKQSVYERRSTINVAKGGGFVGTLLDNKN